MWGFWRVVWEEVDSGWGDVDGLAIGPASAGLIGILQNSLGLLRRTEKGTRASYSRAEVQI